MSDEKLSDEEIIEAARAAIKAGKLPMLDSEHGGMIQQPLTYDPPNPGILCIICGGYLRKDDTPYKLTRRPGEPQMHCPKCFDLWLAAARGV